jgi:hypothetical protein
MTVIIERIGWLMDVTYINDARWKPEINRTPNVEVNLNYFNIGNSNSKSIETHFRSLPSTYAYVSRLIGILQWQ